MRQNMFLVVLVLILSGTSWAWAQPGHEFGEGGFQDRFLETKRTQLGPALGVDQQTVNKLLAIDQKYKPLRHQLIINMKADFQRLQQLMTQTNPPDNEIVTVLKNMKHNRLEMLNLQQRKDEEETAILTPVQQGRYIIYLMGLIREARNIKSGPGGLGGPGGMAPMMPKSLREIPVSRPPQ
jgi:hypothetical protein